MPTYALYVADLLAIGVLVFVLFLRRHRRPELIVALLTANIGVLAVSAALSTSTVGAGLGLGLFGILSIIRLRSEELTHSEIAYYFAALALGLLGGLDQQPSWVDLALMGAVLAAIAIGDSPALAGRSRVQQLMLDRAWTDQVAMVAHVEELLDAHVLAARVVRTDLVNDTTLVEVRFEPPALARRPRLVGAPAAEMLP